MSRRRGLLRIGLGLLALGLVVAVFHAPILTAAARWLRVEDRLAHGDAIVVLAGGAPWREAKAATLYQEGWAPRVIISRPAPRADLEELVKMGIRRADLQGESQQVLEKYGVPAARIVAISEPARTTEPELRLVATAAKASGYRRLILVTSPEHTRRVKLIWSRQAPRDIEGIVVPARENFPFDEWWRRRRAAEAVLHEYLGLVAVSLGVSNLLR
jgi:uncharacterized SAM-binding protein YcdF (DUF218 family)